MGAVKLKTLNEIGKNQILTKEKNKKNPCFHCTISLWKWCDDGWKIMEHKNEWQKYLSRVPTLNSNWKFERVSVIGIHFCYAWSACLSIRFATMQISWWNFHEKKPPLKNEHRGKRWLATNHVANGSVKSVSWCWYNNTRYNFSHCYPKFYFEILEREKIVIMIF